MNSKHSEYDSDMTIQPDQLDLEWLRQPQLCFKYGELLAQARRRQDALKEQMDILRAQLDSKIRATPAVFGLDKTTDKAIESVVLSRPDYKSKADAMIEASFEVNVLFAASRGIDHRKDALENLTRLQGQSYFAGPSTPRNLPEEYKRMRKVQRESFHSTAAAALSEEDAPTVMRRRA